MSPFGDRLLLWQVLAQIIRCYFSGGNCCHFNSRVLQFEFQAVFQLEFDAMSLLLQFATGCVNPPHDQS